MSDDPMLLGELRLERAVASGGMGEIWRASRVATGEPVAVKRLRWKPGPGLAVEHRARLLREIQAFERVAHENIVRCLGSGLDGEGSPYLVLEWLEGETLAERQRRQPLEPPEVVELARRVLRGLGACHERGVVHRDVKPGNLFLVDGDALRVKLLDLGLAIFGDESSRLTQAGAILGTLYYLSPEQASGRPQIDHRADLYSLGVVLYELCTGRLPFESDAPAAVLLKIVAETPPRPRQLRPELPAWLERVILRAMQREPAQRYASARQMLDALERGDAGETSLELRREEPTSSLECRLVSLLCVRLLPGAEEEARAVTGLIEAQGGAVHALLGGQLVGLFGLDRTLGDEASRAVRAGLAARDQLGDRACLLAGTVRLEVGAGLRLDAAELDRCTGPLAACPGGVLMIDGAIREQLGSRLKTESVGGREVAQALEDSDGIRRVQGNETPLVGRETELGAIRGAIARALENEEPEAVLLIGPAGIGKTRLALELRPELRERCALFLEARASPQQRAPYSLVAQAIGGRAGLHVGQDPAARRDRLTALVRGEGCDEGTLLFIGEALGVGFEETVALRVARAEPKLMRERIGAAFESLLRSAASRGVVGLLLEDLHQADAESLSVLERALERLDRTPILLVGTARPDLQASHPELFAAIDATRVELRPLGRRPLRRLLASLLGPEVSPDVEALIASWSEGNPYFAEELVSFLLSRRALQRAEGGWRLRVAPSSLELPAGIEGAIQGRLDQLDTERKELLKAASVVGEVFWEDACAALGFADVERALDELERDGFVVRQRESRIGGSRQWMFRHALLHQVAAQMLPVERARPLHLKAALWLEAQGETDATLLAHHFAEGGDALRAASYQSKAGARALADGDAERAVACFLSAVSVPEGSLAVEERRGRILGLARAHITLSQYDQAWMVLDHLGDDEGRAEVLFLRGRTLLGRGAYARAESTLSGALAAAGAPDLSFDVRHTLFWVIWVQGRYRDAGRIAEALFEEAGRGGRADQLCLAKLAFAYYNVVEGDLSTSVALAESAVAHAREIGHLYREADSLTLLGSAQELVGLHDEALQSLDSAQALADRLKTSFQQASIEACRGHVHLAQGHTADARLHYETAIGRAESAGDFRTLVAALAGQARALACDGPEKDLARAEEQARRALTLATDRAPPSEAEARLSLALVELAKHRPEDAVTHALAGVELLDRLGTQERYEIEILVAASDSLRGVGRPEEADAMLGRAASCMERRAARISDPAIRASYLQRVDRDRLLRELRPAEVPS